MAVSKILVMTCDYQLGNNPGAFSPSAFVGLDLTLPVSVTWLDTSKPDVHLYVETHDIETWGTWNGHAVKLGSTEVGRLKDPNNVFGRAEVFDIVIPMGTFIAATGYSAGQPCKTMLQVVLEQQPANPGLVDDFVITRVDTSDNVVIRLGW
jgi:hypothetical protein